MHVPYFQSKTSLGQLCFGAAVFLIVFANHAQSFAQNNQDVLVWGITGSESGSYAAAMSKVTVQQLLLDIANRPRDVAFIDQALDGSGTTRQELEDLQLIRKQDNQYVINLFLLTKADEAKVREVTQAHAVSLAAAFLTRRKEIETALHTYAVGDVDPKAVAYILLGCFSLDWDGLNITAERGYRSEAVARPNGDHYVPWAREKSDLTLKEIYWGSHNDQQAGVAFTSFGDHYSAPRYGLPDLLSSVPSRSIRPDMPLLLRKNLSRAVWRALRYSSQQAGRMMLALRDGDKSVDELARAADINAGEAGDLLALLSELDYVKQEGARYHTRIPVFSERDLPLVKTMLALGSQIMIEWLAANYEQIKRELTGIIPLRAGVPYASSFTQIWHYVFGLTNRELVEKGLFANPYASDRKYKGFIPAVWSLSLDPDALKSSIRPTGK